MTAELGILNKSGVVLAADSAVTIGGNRKVFNSATKLFQLSKFHPVGLMVYNSASWMGIPLEVIVKQYTKYLGEKSFPELKKYATDFIAFMKTTYFPKIDKNHSAELVEIRFYDLLESLIELARSEYAEMIDNGKITEPKTTAAKDEKINEIFVDILNTLASYSPETKILREFKDYSITDFKKEHRKLLNNIISGFYSTYKLKRTSSVTTKIFKLLFSELIYPFDDNEDYSGIVIAGYGDDQIFPALVEIKLGEIISGRLRYEISKNKEITHDNTAIVIPFAQRDMVDTFFQGIDPDLLAKIGSTISENLEEFGHSLNTKYKLNKLSEINTKINEVNKKIGKHILKLRESIHIQPIVTSVSYLPKEDLIELAESLVNMTSLKRKTSSEIHSVGGPVDIALISKGDGYVWIKRKEKVNNEINGD